MRRGGLPLAEREDYYTLARGVNGREQLRVAWPLYRSPGVRRIPLVPPVRMMLVLFRPDPGLGPNVAKLSKATA